MSSLSRFDVQCVWDAGALLGEGPVWNVNEGALYWLDIKGRYLHRYSPPDAAQRSLALQDEVGCVAFTAHGRILAGARSGIGWLSPDTGEIRLIASPEADQPQNRFNDGKCDYWGRFWAGTMDDAIQQNSGSLYRMGTNYEISRVSSGYIVSNGMDWSLDGRLMYFTDSETGRILIFDFDADTGEAVNPRLFVNVPDTLGVPDGLCVDAGGYIWSTHWDGGRVSRYDPSGCLERTVYLPVLRTTSCAFGGPNLGTLYVTSARTGLSAAQLKAYPLSGGLFAINVGVRGRPAGLFSDQREEKNAI